METGISSPRKGPSLPQPLQRSKLLQPPVSWDTGGKLAVGCQCMYQLPYAWLSARTRLLPRVLRGQTFEKMRPSVGLGNHPLWPACGEGLALPASPVSCPCWLQQPWRGMYVCGDGPRLLLQLWSMQNNAFLSWACPAKLA